MTTTAEPQTRELAGAHWIIYAIVPAGTRLPEFDDAESGASDRHATLLCHGPIAAVVEEIPPHGRLRRAEILAHNAIVNALALDGPTIPVAFGSVYADAHQIVDDLLAQHADDLLATLQRLRHKHQFIVRVQFRTQELLTTIAASDDDAAALQREPLARPGRAIKFQSGERATAAVHAHQRVDVEQLIDRLCAHSDKHHVNDRSVSDAAVSVSFLVADDHRAAFEAAAEEYAARVHDRSRVQLLGPLAASISPAHDVSVLSSLTRPARGRFSSVTGRLRRATPHAGHVGPEVLRRVREGMATDIITVGSGRG